jgi:alkanesulfonate monooxygenase SsuD/methylene tetrahydromethanopterin reductase-like flavin-dependent oxidoreductase (luciferase family)
VDSGHPYYNPVLLARRLTTIDVLSKGRLRVGFGVGWSPDEMEAAGADMKVRGVRADEFLQVLKAIWTTDPAEYHGKFFSLPKSYIGRSRRRSHIRPSSSPLIRRLP